MTLSAFTVITSSEILEESMRSVLPFVDEFVINLHGASDKNKELVGRLMQEFPKVLSFFEEDKSTSDEVTMAIKKCTGDWVLALKDDELLHEAHAKKLRDWVERAEAEDADGIAFQYLYFEKDYTTRREVESRPTLRLIKKNESTISIPPISIETTLTPPLFIFKYIQTGEETTREKKIFEGQHPKVMIEKLASREKGEEDGTTIPV